MKIKLFTRCFSVVGMLFLFQPAASVALDLDWSGQFWTESHFLFNSTMSPNNHSTDAARAAAGGYYIPGPGESNALFQTLFLRLRPSVVVNDSVYIKSEWWVGDPAFSVFGGAYPHTMDQRMYYSSQSRGVQLTVQRLWAEMLSDIGTVQVGRMPLDWGLGLVWNGGNSLWDRYVSTGDAFRLVSKFGAFNLTPSVVRYSTGNSLSGSCQNPASGTCTSSLGSGGLMDYSILLKYDNMDEEFELGLNFIRRIGGASQDATVGTRGPYGTSGVLLTIWDVMAKKRLGPVTLAAEMPVISGVMGDAAYNSIAFAMDAQWDVTSNLEFGLRGGYAPGQPNGTGAANTEFKAFYFHPNYKPALIMFNYQPANLVGPATTNNPATPLNSVRSIFDNPVTNAMYFSLGGSYELSRWNFGAQWTYALANTAAVEGSSFYNSWTRQYVATATGVGRQDSSLGWELDVSADYQLDDAFRFGLDMGLFMPGGFYRFSNTTTANTISPVFAGVLRLGVEF